MKRIGTRLAELTRLFEITGAPEPQKWAESEVREDIPQLASFLFLRQAWREVVAEATRSGCVRPSRTPSATRTPLARALWAGARAPAGVWGRPGRRRRGRAGHAVAAPV